MNDFHYEKKLLVTSNKNSIRQLFTYPIPDTKPDTVAKAKKEIESCASEMGFIGHEPFKVQKYEELGKVGYRLEAIFNT